MLKVSIIQRKCGYQTQDIHDSIHDLASQHVNIICLPELCLQTYIAQTEDEEKKQTAIMLESDAIKPFQQTAKHNNVMLILPIYEQTKTGKYNTAIIINADGSILTTYKKSHIPHDTGYYEKYYFKPSTEGYEVIDTPYGKIGVLICFDQWFPEPVRILALKGANIVFYPTAIGWDMDADEQTKKKELDAWKIVQRGNAIANNIYIASINRVGIEDKLNFWGNSFICGPQGEMLSQANQEEETTLTATIDPEKIKKLEKYGHF